MGFPDWTLWGMGLAAAGALFAITLALLGQSPGILKRIRLSRAGLDRHVRAYTGYAFALLILAIGFFFAGVPLGPGLASQAPPVEQGDTNSFTQQATNAAGSIIADQLTLTPATAIQVTPSTPETGAFGGPPSGRETPDQVATTTPVIEITTTLSFSATADTRVSQVATQEITATAQRSTATSTATPTPTETPTPTLTPTPISGETAVVTTEGGTLWLRRSPGGQNIVLVRDGDVVLLLGGHANQGGILWREVATVAGEIGWLPEEFLLPAG